MSSSAHVRGVFIDANQAGGGLLVAAANGTLTGYSASKLGRFERSSGAQDIGEMMSYFVSDFPSDWPGASDWLGAQLSELRGTRRAADGRKSRDRSRRTSTEIGSRVTTPSGAILPAPVVETDDFEEGLRQVRREYACRLPGKVFALAACLEETDKGLRVLAEARELAHRMKKTAETSGFDHVAELASRLERNLSHLVDDPGGGRALILRQVDELLADLLALAEREFGAHWAADLAQQSGKAD